MYKRSTLNMRRSLLVLLIMSAGIVSCEKNSEKSILSEKDDVSRVLNDFHDAASKADGVRYFSHFAENGIFLGTDATEKWTVEQFRALYQPYFDKGKGWTYAVLSREIYFSPDKKMAWFDEAIDNRDYGLCRGTGVLRKTGKEWKIAHYNLTIPIPNSITDKVVKLIRNTEK